jgi:hypothetical protein
MPSFLKTAGVLLATALLLGWGITAADTWVHVSSSTVPVTVRSAVSSGDVASYGRQLGSWCLGEDWAGSACTLNPAAATVFLNNDTEAILMAFDRSTQNSARLEGETVVLLPANSAVDVDYSAISFGLRTSCKPASLACGLEHPSRRSYRFDCTAAGFPNERRPSNDAKGRPLHVRERQCGHSKHDIRDGHESILFPRRSLAGINVQRSLARSGDRD